MSDSKNVILVTGGNAGIGLDIVRQLLSNANNHVIIACRSPEKGSAALKNFQAMSLAGTGSVVQLDVTDEKSVAAAAAEVEKAHGREVTPQNHAYCSKTCVHDIALDVLVNNAGAAYNFTNAPEVEHMLSVYKTNVIGPHLTTEAFMPLLRKSTTTTPRVVHVSSGAGSVHLHLNPPPKLPKIPHRSTAYPCSKAALSMLLADQVTHYEAEKVKFFAVSPGFTESGLGPFNKKEMGAKPVAEGARPIVQVVEGERDEEWGRLLHGHEDFHEKPGNGAYAW